MSTRKQRRKFTSEFKAKVALEAIKEHKTLSELSKEFDLHGNQILQWKREFLSNLGATFEKENQKEKIEKEKDRMLRKIGQLELERDFLKKTAEHFGLKTERE